MDEVGILFNIIDQYGKKAAVTETGFSTYTIVVPLPPPLPPLVIVRTEEMQKEFINTVFPAIREKASNTGKYLTFITWYELMDEPHVLFAPGRHFGIVHANFTPKLGYNDLKQQLNGW